MLDAIVVGCGIMGATISKALQNQGREVLILDDGRKMAGTTPSGGHLKPSWFGMDKKYYLPAMECLDQIWGLHKHEFLIHPKMTRETIHRVDIDVVKKTEHEKAIVTYIKNHDGNPIVWYRTASGDTVERETKLLIITAGFWTKYLFPIKIVGKQGVSFRLSGTLKEPFIRPWAPYKQIVCHQQAPDEIWAGDGSTILKDNWTEGRTKECLVRCQKAVYGDDYAVTPTRTIQGIRPYCNIKKGVPCLLEKIGKSTWVATGAAKLGTIASGYAALRIMEDKLHG